MIKKFKMPLFLFFFLAIFYMELILRIFTCPDFFTAGLIFVTLFSLVPAFVIHSVITILPTKARKTVTIVLMSIFFLIYSSQVTYHGFFNRYFVMFSLKAGGVGQITEGGMFGNTLSAIFTRLPAILLLSLPIVAVCLFFGKVITTKKSPKISLILFAFSLLIYIISAIVADNASWLSGSQNIGFDPNYAVQDFGLLRTECLDIKYNLLGISQKLDIETETKIPVNTPTDKPVIYGDNIMDIDFVSLNQNETDGDLRLLNDYFAAKEPTRQNEYTGMYKGYNLIYICAEGFSPYAIDKNLTPTLYKMQQDGFKFTNFYTPMWGVSTSDGEYTVCTGLLPKSGVWSFYTSHTNYMPFCLGNIFKTVGVNESFAYHNNSYTYYRREASHPNIGYNYKGMNSGVEKYVKNVWPQSDLEMISGSVSEYLKSDKQFHAYYMTVSGHLAYTKIDNSMSYKNWDLVKDLNCSDPLKAYYACNIELDRAMEKLLCELNAAGVADKTVISIAPDHYPYGLERNNSTDTYAVWRELLGHDVDTEFEIYKSCFLLYCQGTKNAPTVDKYCYSVDVLPTVLNLFGFEYDSRLLIGSDILSSSEGIVAMSNRSFITDMGKYNSRTKEFTLHEGKSFANDTEKDAYILNMRKTVNNKYIISAKILDKDYYGYVFGK